MDVFAALADPVRREILLRLGERTLTAGEIAGSFDISRPAVSRHLRLLREAGLVIDEARGRHRFYRLEPAALTEVQEWLDRLREAWPFRLDALETEVYRTRRERRADPPTQREKSA